jgi:uncharacterized protein
VVYLLGKEERVRFVYNEAAAIVSVGGAEHIVIGDLHIGVERPLIKKGIRVYNAEEHMLKRIKKISGEFKTKNLIVLGDVKDTILYPENAEQNAVRAFFKGLRDDSFDVTVTAGNHDPHLGEVVDCRVVEELVLGDFAFLHGHRWPSDKAMGCGFLFAGHNHVAIGLRDKSGGYYNQKAWLVAKLSKKYGLEKYPNANRSIQLIVLPAFNDLITGMPIGRLPQGENLSPLFRNNIFGYRNAYVYSLRGEQLGKVSGIRA